MSATDEFVAMIELERERHWHRKQDSSGQWVRDERATALCEGCSRAHRVLDDLLAKLRPAIEREERERHPVPSRPCCDVCEP